MMSLDDLIALETLTEAIFRAEHERVRDLNQREAEIRRSLSGLDQARRNARDLPQELLAPLRQIGGEILWQGWVGQQRATLNRQLARCLAQKATRMAKLRHAYGRNLAVQEMLRAETSTLRSARQRMELQHLDALSILKAETE